MPHTQGSFGSTTDTATKIRKSLRRLAALAALGLFAPTVVVHALEIEEASIADLQNAYKDHRLTIHQVVEAHLARIATYDKQGPLINSFVTVNSKALEEADKQD